MNAGHSRWYKLYYLLAAFDLLTLSASLMLNHALLDIHAESIVKSSDWVERMNEFESLAATAGLVNAPGNDVFDSKNVPLESSLLEKRLLEFNRQLSAEYQFTDSSNLSAEAKGLLKNHFDQIALAMKEMTKEAKDIFGYFSKNNTALAASRMATMDRKFAELNVALMNLRASARTLQAKDLETERNRAQKLGQWEYVFALIIVLMVTGITWYGHLISKRVLEANNQITKQQEIIQTNARLSSLGVMASGIAHEINNPLGIIKGCISLIQRKLKSESFSLSEIQDYLSKSDKTADRIAAIIRGLRAFARDGEKDPLELTPLSQIIEEASALCSDKLKKAGVRLISTIEDKNVAIHCRHIQITQAIVILINNAIDAIEHIADPWVEVQVSNSSQFIEISVTDCGNGIPRATVEKLMTPFFTTKEIGKGTGLGLSIALGISESHGGRLFYDAQSKNTRFTFTLSKFLSEPKSELRQAA